jgi:hypothetical protein
MQNGTGAGFALTDDGLLRWAAMQFASGRLRVCTESVTVPDVGDPTPKSGPVAAPPERAFPLPDRSQKSQSVSRTDDQSAFPADVALAEVAETLKQASRAGVPFCEECLKAALRG